MKSSYKIVKSFDQIKRIAERCKVTGYASFDFETKAEGGAHSKNDDCTILGISYQLGFAYSIPLYHKDSPFTKEQVKEILTYLFIHVFENVNIVKIAFNAKHELKWINRYGGDIKGIYLDPMLAKYLLDEEPPNDLKSLTDRFIPEFGDYEDEIKSLVKQHGGWAFVPLKPLSKYCCMDCDMSLRLQIYFENLLLNEKRYPRFYLLYRNMCMMQTKVYADSEMMGMGVNKKYLDKIELETRNQITENEKNLLKIPKLREFQKWRVRHHVKKLIAENTKEIEKIESDDTKTDASKMRMIKNREEKISRYVAGQLLTKKEVVGEINFNSPNIMVELLFTSPRGFNFKIVKYTKDKITKQDTTRPSTDEEVLLLLKSKDKSGFISMLLKHRELSKLWSTYMVAIQNRLTEETHRIHSSFKIHGTTSGRMSCISDDTKLLTDAGEVRIGDIIPNYTGELKINNLKVLTHKGNWKPIIKSINKGNEEMYKIELDDGKSIDCTLTHKFFTNRGVKKLSEFWDNTTGTFDSTIKIISIHEKSIKEPKKKIKIY